MFKVIVTSTVDRALTGYTSLSDQNKSLVLKTLAEGSYTAPTDAIDFEFAQEAQLVNLLIGLKLVRVAVTEDAEVPAEKLPLGPVVSVASATRNGLNHTVQLTADGTAPVSCTCEAITLGGRDWCRHQDAVSDCLARGGSLLNLRYSNGRSK